MEDNRKLNGATRAAAWPAPAKPEAWLPISRRQALRRGVAFSAVSVAAGAGAALGQQAPAGAGPESQQKRAPLVSLRDRITPIPPEEYAARHECARKLMGAAGLDAILLAGGSSMVYFTGFNWGRSERLFAAVLPLRGELAYVCPAFERDRAQQQIRFGNDLRVWEEDESPYQLLAKVFADRGAHRIGIEETTPYFVAAGLAREAPALALSLADPITAGCRMVKSPRELALMEVAAVATRNAIGWAFAQLQDGMTARQVAELISAGHTQQGVRPGFALVGMGEASAFPHGSSLPQKIREGDVVLADVGCQAEGYQSDVTRTIVFGKPTAKQRRVWDIVKKAQAAALEAARPGVAAESVDAAARRLIEDAGFGPGYKFFTHRLGHGIGLDGHEWPYLVRGNKLRLGTGMTTSNEPGIYIKGEFGVRIEDVMVMGEGGARLLGGGPVESMTGGIGGLVL